MQWAQYIHATIAVLLIAVMIAHIYIGSLGMEGAYDAMGSGKVDLAWARPPRPLGREKKGEDGQRPADRRNGANPCRVVFRSKRRTGWPGLCRPIPT